MLVIRLSLSVAGSGPFSILCPWEVAGVNNILRGTVCTRFQNFPQCDCSQ